MAELYARCDPRLTAANRINQQAIQPRNGTRSVAHYGPARIPEGMGPPTFLQANSGIFAPADPQGGWDALGGALMHVAQADMLDSSPNVLSGVNGSGIWDVPGAPQGQQFLRLQPTSSARQVQSLPQAIWPTIWFQPPPSFGDQTVPVYAVGV